MSRRPPDTGARLGSLAPKVGRSSAERRRRPAGYKEYRSRSNAEYYASRKPQPGWWARLTDHERADWLRERARGVCRS